MPTQITFSGKPSSWVYVQAKASSLVLEVDHRKHRPHFKVNTISQLLTVEVDIWNMEPFSMSWGQMGYCNVPFYLTESFILLATYSGLTCHQRTDCRVRMGHLFLFRIPSVLLSSSVSLVTKKREIGFRNIISKPTQVKKATYLCDGCGSVGWAVVSDTNSNPGKKLQFHQL